MEDKNTPRENLKFPSELRFDPVSKDWIVIATGRARRPETFKKEQRHETNISTSICPFCNIEIQNSPTYISAKGESISLNKGIPKDWTLVCIPNKFPAFVLGESLNEKEEGPYKKMDGVGFHEVVITKDHNKQIAQFSTEQVKEIIDAYQQRYLEMKKNKFVKYISIFHNHGAEAGASIAHPHSQMIALPLTDPDIQSSISGSKEFSQDKNRCVHCSMLEWDKQDGRRIIFENDGFIVLIPYASRVAFETRIYPKKHEAYFENITEENKKYFAEALKVALSKLYKGLGDPAYNFFLHTAPCDGQDHSHYHWHLEILPKTSTWAGFELGVGIEISTIEPEKAAEFLKKQ